MYSFQSCVEPVNGEKNIPTPWFKNHNTLGRNIGLYTVYLAKDKRGKKIDSKST